MPSGWRTRILTRSRAARPSRASVRAASIPASSPSSIRTSVGSGNARQVHALATRSARCSQSARNGAIGASSRATTTSASCSVANAARVSASSVFPQNRSRLRRTYQFDRSSTTKSPIARAARVSSYASRSRPTDATSRCSRDRIQRSSTFVGVRRRATRVGRPALEVRVQREEPVRVRQRVERPPRRLAQRLRVEALRHPRLADRQRGTSGSRRRRTRRSPPTGRPRCRGTWTSSARPCPAAGRSPPRCGTPGRRPSSVEIAMQRVEPAARLVHALADEVRRELPSPPHPGSRTGSATARTASRPSRTRRRSPRACAASCRRTRRARPGVARRSTACADRSPPAAPRRPARASSA